MTNIILSLMMLLCFALLIGAYIFWRKGQVKQPLLMLLLTAIIIANIVIWTMPNDDGKTLIKAAQENNADADTAALK